MRRGLSRSSGRKRIRSTARRRSPSPSLSRRSSSRSRRRTRSHGRDRPAHPPISSRESRTTRRSGRSSPRTPATPTSDTGRCTRHGRRSPACATRTRSGRETRPAIRMSDPAGPVTAGDGCSSTRWQTTRTGTRNRGIPSSFRRTTRQRRRRTGAGSRGKRGFHTLQTSREGLITERRHICDEEGRGYGDGVPLGGERGQPEVAPGGEARLRATQERIRRVYRVYSTSGIPRRGRFSRSRSRRTAQIGRIEISYK